MALVVPSDTIWRISSVSRVAARRRVTSYSALASRSHPSCRGEQARIAHGQRGLAHQGIEQLALLDTEVQGP